MRTLFGVGTPRGLQGRLAALVALVIALWTHVVDLWRDRRTPSADRPVCIHAASSFRAATRRRVRMGPLTTGC